ncbi:EAL domain-containing protein [Streptomyces stelliscabiei]|uniref:Diguanylate cyclase (GGDEF)-like protein/PAS domain S-box-containing protein n=1 Tax=Streptomyces stelliscabiei TaxID=146820 RepID=A0A8I0PD04_9ACTN|nr:EAL domain-containing protein [Streptomyces stelliscabiei]KND42422.1 phosphodiesterase [Streptomyces stelliscabiei]MBE1600449.1 diguanylate cyclase (GGDEF)-like protein/PAS domain S-box-containing protein [Streptomyces stelliscabiei]MDX2518265.1 EAL domain-containing protein [Streptomyces stelliscabiei]MDX2554493.1 EAL domain-containing protein [Streptomyces stelliscabiei]MDX2613702.1 EAL domain-containing protein [Streptomyces stelliscabiei]
MSPRQSSAPTLSPALRAAKPLPGPLPGGRAPDRGGASLRAQIVLALLCAAYAVGAAFGWGNEQVALVMGDFGLSAAAAAAAVSCFRYARSRRSRFRPAWLLFALSSAMAALGNGVWGWYEVVLERPVPEPSYADLFFLCFAPPAIVGLLVLAKRPVTKAGWICLALDSWLIGGSLVTLSWSLALAQNAQIDDSDTAHTALSLAYPLLDIALVSMVLALHFRRSSMHRSAVNTAIGALALTVMCDALFTSPLLHTSYESGQLLDAGWFAGSVLLAYAPWAGQRHGQGDEGGHARVVHEHIPGQRPDVHPGLRHDVHPGHRHEVHPGHRHDSPQGGHAHALLQGGGHGRYPATRPIAGSLAALTPYLAAAVCTLGILYNVLNGRRVDRVVLITACTVVLALVVRQGIMLLDNITLTQELAQKENHFRSLVQGSSDVIMIAAPNGILRYVSPAAAGVYGRPAEDLVGKELASIIHPEDLGCVVHEVRRFLAASPAEEPTTRIECRFKAGAGGGWLNVESTVNRHHGGLIFNSRDVTERVRLQAQLQHNAEHDPLTDLPNRALFTKRVQQALSGRRSSDRGAALRNTAVLFIDLDGFKAVNDTIGHQAGDELLVQAARRLQDAVRQGDTASRLGGDEFAALIVGDGTHDRVARERHIVELADRLRIALSQPYTIDGNDVRVAASIGVSFAEPGLGAGELLRNADLAMYRAKASGKGRVELYKPQMQQDVVRRAELATRLRAALHDGEFMLLNQPVVELATGRISSVATAARWRSSQGVLFTPAEFLRVSEGSEKTAELGRWMLEQAVEQAADRLTSGLNVPVSVRMSARRLLDRSLPPGSLETLLTRHGLPSGSLVVELSDTELKGPPDELERRLNQLRRLGVRIALDGLGSGHAAITALRRLPVDVLKLDRGLVEGIVESTRLQKITRGLLHIADDLGLQSVADGVDLPEQVLALRAMGCTHGQGAAFCGPLDEYRLRRALSLGHFPVPSGPAEPAFAGGTREQEGRVVASAPTLAPQG